MDFKMMQINKTSGSLIDTSCSSIDINIEGCSDLNKEEIIKIINEAMERHGIKRKNEQKR
jgi:sensor c-di-GMP phosphodiesterase-like protein